MPARPTSPTKQLRTRAIAAVQPSKKAQPRRLEAPTVNHSNGTPAGIVRRVNPRRSARPSRYDQPVPAPLITSAPGSVGVLSSAKKARKTRTLQKKSKSTPKPRPASGKSGRANKHRNLGLGERDGKLLDCIIVASKANPKKQVRKGAGAGAKAETLSDHIGVTKPIGKPLRKKEVQESATQATVRPQAPDKTVQSIHPWLESIQPPSVISGSEMNSSSLLRDQIEDVSTVKDKGSRSNKLTPEKLRYRRVQDEASTDKKLSQLNKILKWAPPKPALNTAAEQQAFVSELLQSSTTPLDGHEYSFLDRFSLELDRRKAEANYPIINPFYFDAQLKKCLSKNEAVLQRTIMVNVFHHYWLDKVFDWNTEGQWKQQKDTRLPSRKDDQVTLPKPDLAISFTLRSFTQDEDDSDPIPTNVADCLSPDGGKRCFPFLFMEVKKAADDLQAAHRANLHNTSQALYNIYQWMVIAGMEDECFQNVRAFSVVFNAQDMEVRVHRVEKRPDGHLSFRFAEVTGMKRYDRDLACTLLSSILTEYAATELYTVLEKAFRAVIAKEEQHIASKRKNSELRNSAQKKPRSSSTSNQSTGQSFDMSKSTT